MAVSLQLYMTLILSTSTLVLTTISNTVVY